MIMESQKTGGIGFPMVRYRTQSKENGLDHYMYPATVIVFYLLSVIK